MILSSSPKRLIHCCESSLLFYDGSYCPPEGILGATPPPAPRPAGSKEAT